ncbi:hypothetical protein CRE_29766 [Caenorhabditis remanei]|uniref:Uncharacterized protein n=1 Tax=Caenorhabditis remanei TaxID=31234 RepID=E3LVP2_CAERE|nr:hypothetical protein CRE_29766 [Caenorhabditis remanei]
MSTEVNLSPLCIAFLQVSWVTYAVTTQSFLGYLCGYDTEPRRFKLMSTEVNLSPRFIAFLQVSWVTYAVTTQSKIGGKKSDE